MRRSSSRELTVFGGFHGGQAARHPRIDMAAAEWYDVAGNGRAGSHATGKVEREAPLRRVRDAPGSGQRSGAEAGRRGHSRMREPRHSESDDEMETGVGTTRIFVELLVIGAGGAAAVLLAMVAVYDVPAAHVDKLISAPGILVVTPVVYVLGIIIDRLADWLFESPTSHVYTRHGCEPERMRHVRMNMYVRAPLLARLSEYSRSRIRICRGWAVDGALIVLAGTLFIGVRPGALTGVLLGITGAFIVLLTLGCVFAWFRLTKSEVGALREYEKGFDGAA